MIIAFRSSNDTRMEQGFRLGKRINLTELFFCEYNTMKTLSFSFHHILVALTCCLMLCATSATADEVERGVEPLKQCAEIARVCFARSAQERSNCLFSSFKHPFCEGTSLGEVLHQRWMMSPVRPTQTETAAAFLGPQLIDQKCLANFDSKLVGKLIETELSEETMKAMETELLACTSQLAESLTRP